MVIGSVYKICTDEKYTDECYIGSTFDTLEKRFIRHRTDYKKWKKGKSHYFLSSFTLFDNYGVENCYTELIKQYDVIDREHLEIYETLWIRKFKNKCINKNIPFCIKKLYEKVYYIINKEAHLEQAKVFYQVNKDKILKRQKQPWTCEICNVSVNTSNKSYHLKSKKHQEHLSKTQGQVFEQQDGKWICEFCNLSILTKNKNTHFKSKRHLNNLSREQ